MNLTKINREQTLKEIYVVTTRTNDFALNAGIGTVRLETTLWGHCHSVSRK